MTCKVLRLFVNRFTADKRYSLLGRDNSRQTIEMHLSQKGKFFKFASNFEHFQTKMTLIAHAFPKLRTPKDVVR